MKILIIGSNGLLGTDLQSCLKNDHQLYLPIKQELDISNKKSILNYFETLPEDISWCINCAAYTQVDHAEDDRDQSYSLNVLGPKLLSEASRRFGIRLLHISTDYVFDGYSKNPYHENDQENPLNYYGQTKLEGENFVLKASNQNIIARTSWLFGTKRPCFPEIIINAWLADKTLKVIDDEISCPTYTKDLSQILKQIIQLPCNGGIYHTVGTQSLSRYNYAFQILQAYQKVSQSFNRKIHIERISCDNWQSNVTRPQYSVLSMNKIKQIGLTINSNLQNSLEDYCYALMTQKNANTRH